jgi:hypothetical protein
VSSRKIGPSSALFFPGSGRHQGNKRQLLKHFACSDIGNKKNKPAEFAANDGKFRHFCIRVVRVRPAGFPRLYFLKITCKNSLTFSYYCRILHTVYVKGSGVQSPR